MKERCVVHRLGEVAYERAWRLQEVLAAEIARGERTPTLLLLEHPHTYTFGRGGHAENLLWDEAELARHGIGVHWVDRGGDATYHGPGQLVGYPLLPLAPGGLHATNRNGSNRLPQADYVGYLRRLETALIEAMQKLGVSACQVEGLTGVWVRPHLVQELSQLPAKIASIGVKVDARGISRHGFALNVDPDMTYWDGIVGCGLKDYPVASLAGLLVPPPRMEIVMEAVTEAFGETFDYQMVEASVNFVAA